MFSRNDFSIWGFLKKCIGMVSAWTRSGFDSCKTSCKWVSLVKSQVDSLNTLSKETHYLHYGIMLSICQPAVFVFSPAMLQELSKITMPIVFNEPLSFLQRITEYMEHTYLIHKACTLSDSFERMQVSASFITQVCRHKIWMFIRSLRLICQFVAAFAVSAVASQWDRTGKPFNPLLGETYELMR